MSAWCLRRLGIRKDRRSNFVSMPFRQPPSFFRAYSAIRFLCPGVAQPTDCSGRLKSISVAPQSVNELPTIEQRGSAERGAYVSRKVVEFTRSAY